MKTRNVVISYAGLAVFVLGVLTAVGILIWDLTLAVGGHVTITEWATAVPWRAIVISGITLIGVAGLWVHFIFWPVPRKTNARNV